MPLRLQRTRGAWDLFEALLKALKGLEKTKCGFTKVCSFLFCCYFSLFIYVFPFFPPLFIYLFFRLKLFSSDLFPFL